MNPASAQAVEQATGAFLEKGILGALVVILMAVVAFLFIKLSSKNDQLVATTKELQALEKTCAAEKQTLNDNHKQEIRDNGKALSALLERVLNDRGQ